MIADSMKTIVCLNVHVIQNALLVVHAQGGAEEFLQRINVKLSGVTKPKLVMMIAELNEPNALKDAIVIVHARSVSYINRFNDFFEKYVNFEKFELFKFSY